MRIIDRVADALSSVTNTVVLVSNAPDAADWLPGLRVVPDLRAERGSLVAIHSALAFAQDTALVVAWDMPFVSAAMLGRIASLSQDELFATIPEGPSGLEPFCAAYTLQCLPIVTAALDRGDLRVRSFLATLPSIHTITVDAPTFGDSGRLFFNVNTPNDLRVAEEMANDP